MRAELILVFATLCMLILIKHTIREPAPKVQEAYVFDERQCLDKFWQIDDFFKHTEYSEVRHIVLAVAIVESGWLQNKRHIDFNNYFSVKDYKHPLCKKNVKSIYCLKQFESLEENLDYMVQYFAKNNYPIDEKGFLEKLEGYAEDKLHTQKVKWISNKFKMEK
jgi:hypothetical protein